MKVTALIAATLFVVSAHATETAPAHKGHGAAATAPTTTTTTTTEAAPAPGTTGATASAPAKDCKTLKGKAKKACMDEQKAAANTTGETATH